MKAIPTTSSPWKNRPAAVAGVDGGIRLHRQERPVADVHVILHLDAETTPRV